MKDEHYSHQTILFGWQTLFQKMRTNGSNLGLTFIPTSKALTKAIFDKIGEQTTHSVIFACSPYLASRYKAAKTIDDIQREMILLLEHAKPPKVVFISSAAVYGFKDDKTLSYSETAELNGVTSYAKEKIRLESLLQRSCAANGQTLTILRVAGLYGVDLQAEKLSFLDKLRKNQLTQAPQNLQISHAGQQMRDFCDFSFLAKLVEFFAKNATGNEVFNVSTTAPIKLWDLVEKYNQQHLACYHDDWKQSIHNHLDTKKLEFFLAQQELGGELGKELKVLQKKYA